MRSPRVFSCWRLLLVLAGNLACLALAAGHPVQLAAGDLVAVARKS